MESFLLSDNVHFHLSTLIPVIPLGVNSSRAHNNHTGSRGRGSSSGLRRRGGGRTPRPSHGAGRGSGGSARRSETSSSSVAGLHDLSNVETWVCAICSNYDPVLPEGVDPEVAANTEWVGCDCGRWFHQFCTKLEKVDETFSCGQVKLKCLPPTD